MLIYCIPTLKSFDLCGKSIDAVMHGSRKPDKIYVMDNSGISAAKDYLHTMGYTSTYPNLEIITAYYNLGVAGSWNEFMRINERMGGDCIIANDDIEVHHFTIEAIVERSKQDFDQIFFAGSGASGNAFSLFILTQLGYKLIGPFDERFYPAYFEDNDYARRMSIAGYNIITVQEATYDHVGSSTLKAYTPEERDAHHRAFRKNASYYEWKWGGLVGQETRMEPQLL